MFPLLRVIGSNVRSGMIASARRGHPQAELIVTSRLAVVDDRDAERMIPHTVERRLADEHSRIADNSRATAWTCS